MRADAHGEEEGEHREPEPAPRDVGDEAAADDDVREMPGRVRRVQQRHVVTPTASRQRVEGGPHALTPEITTPPPRLIRRASTSPMPAARHSSSWWASG